MELQGDFKTLLKTAADSMSDETGITATLTAGGESMVVEVQPRGSYRRQLCPELPPMKIILPKGKKPAPFTHLDRDLKYVTNCQLKPDALLADAVERELLLYRWVEALGLPGFRVRATTTTYRLPDGSIYSRGPGFLIENIKDLSRRIGFTELSPSRPFNELSMEINIVEEFLRNPDYYIPEYKEDPGHNVRRLANLAGEPVLFIPYDFDLSRHTQRETEGKISEIRSALGTWTDRDQKPLAIGPLQNIVDKKAALLAEVEAAKLSAKDKKILREWIANFTKVATEIITGYQRELGKTP